MMPLSGVCGCGKQLGPHRDPAGPVPPSGQGLRLLWRLPQRRSVHDRHVVHRRQALLPAARHPRVCHRRAQGLLALCCLHDFCFRCVFAWTHPPASQSGTARLPFFLRTGALCVCVVLQADAVECGTEDFVVLAMSSSAATERVLSLGSSALQALGVGSRAERLMKDISKIINVSGCGGRGGEGGGRCTRTTPDPCPQLESVPVTSPLLSLGGFCGHEGSHILLAVRLWLCDLTPGWYPPTCCSLSPPPPHRAVPGLSQRVVRGPCHEAASGCPEEPVCRGGLGQRGRPAVLPTRGHGDGAAGHRSSHRATVHHWWQRPVRAGCAG